MSFQARCPRSVVADHLCERCQSVSMHRPARLMGLRAEGADSDPTCFGDRLVASFTEP
jgi:hypothetical protein